MVGISPGEYALESYVVHCLQFLCVYDAPIGSSFDLRTYFLRCVQVYYYAFPCGITGT